MCLEELVAECYDLVERKLCTRVAVMQKGLIVEEGETEQVFHPPKDPYTQRLIAAIPTRRKIDD